MFYKNSLKGFQGFPQVEIHLLPLLRFEWCAVRLYLKIHNIIWNFKIFRFCHGVCPGQVDSLSATVLNLETIFFDNIWFIFFPMQGHPNFSPKYLENLLSKNQTKLCDETTTPPSTPTLTVIMRGNGMQHNISEPITWRFHQAIWFGFLITDSGENLWCPCEEVMRCFFTLLCWMTSGC